MAHEENSGHGLRWADGEISWSFAIGDHARDAAWAFSDVMDEGFAVAMVRDALAAWSAASGLHFTQVADSLDVASAPDIRIGWAEFGAGAPQIGLAVSRHDAHAHLRPGVLVQIEDPAERALVADAEGTLVYAGTSSSVHAVILHEIGHALGLGHDDDASALMFYAAGSGNRDLDAADVAAIRALYPEYAPVAVSLPAPPAPAAPAAHLPDAATASLPVAAAGQFARIGLRGAEFADDGRSVSVGVLHFAAPRDGVLAFADGRVVYDAADPAAQVVRLYAAALDRAPDQAGLNHQVARLDAGAGLAEVAADLLRSPEFAARYGAGLTDGQFVQRLYANVLDRAADVTEAGYYGVQLAAGQGRAQTLVAFSESPENQARTAGLVDGGIWDVSESAATVARLYDTMLGRLPDVAGLSYQRGRLDAGATTALDVAREFAASPEFATRYGAGTDSARYVDLLYVNTLDRSASASENAYYAAQLDGGALSRAQVALAFAESPEHQALTRQDVMSETHHGIAFA